MIKIEQIFESGKSDDTFDYKVSLDKHYTVEQLVVEIIAMRDLRGHISINKPFFFPGVPRCEYKNNQLLSFFPKEYLPATVKEVSASGGWGAIDWVVKIDLNEIVKPEIQPSYDTSNESDVTIERELVSEGYIFGGLSKREYFSIKALQSIILLKSDGSNRDDVLTAIQYADLLISELEPKPSPKIFFTSKEEAIEAMNQGKRVWHRFFLDEQYIKRVDDLLYQDHDGISFLQSDFWSIRTGIEWETGWRIID